MADVLFTDDFKDTPYWWDEAPRVLLPETALPATTDVVIIGSGNVGLSSALTLARGGRDVVVLESEEAGYGASTRNAGYVGRSLWSKYSALEAKYGARKAVEFCNETVASHHHVVKLIESEQITCHFNYCGRFIAAQTQAQYDALEEDLEAMQRQGVEMDGTMVSPSQVRDQIATDYYLGGMVLEGTGSLHPGLLHKGLMERALSAGAAIIDRTPVTGVEKDGKRFTVTTTRGRISTRDVIVATNGYTGPPTPYFQRRLVTVPAYIITTEPLGREKLKELFPTGRTVIDSKINIYFTRQSPDGERLLFGSRTGMRQADLRIKAREIYGDMLKVFPQLEGTRISHSWDGNMGFTFDKMPHTGQHEGVEYATGLCGTGIPMGTYLGHKTALRVLGDPEGATAFDGEPFPTAPFYNGNAWFLPLTMAWYGLKDRLTGS
jgi:glycine/D-amino acid oxidase-like deaminating enzyme